LALEDADLIARALVDGDTHAFGELVKRHQSLVRNLLRKLLRGDDARADDLAQETFLKAHRNLHQFGQRARFSTWLCGIAYNEFRIWARSAHEDASLDDTLYEPSIASGQRSHDFRQDLNGALKFLTLEERTAVVCCAMQGMSHAEAVEVLGWPLGTVKTHLLRGKEKLRNLLAEWAHSPTL
jgi:RNA polymerase sigma-70 factor (ECF subfamily)